MALIYPIAVVLGILVLLIFIVALRIKLVFDSENTNFNITLIWLDPLLEGLITMENNKPMLTIYLFKKKVIKTIIWKSSKRSLKNNNGFKLIKLSNPKDININASYGFKDPYITGITCGAINIVSQFINIDSISQRPNFQTSDDYIYFDATAKINIGSALIKLLNY